MGYIVKGFGPPTLSGTHNPSEFDRKYTYQIYCYMRQKLPILFTVVSTEPKTVPKT